MSADDRSAAAEPQVVFLAYARGLIDQLRGQRLDVAPLLALAGLDEAALDEPGRTIPAETYVQLWQQAEKLSGDTRLGLHVGEVVRPGKYGVLGYVMMSCETLGESLLRQLRYQDLVGKSGRSELVQGGDRCELRWHSQMARASPHVGEEHVASWVAFARWILGAPGRDPIEVQFEHPAPADTSEHQRLFRCPLRFGQPHTAVAFEAGLLKLPLRDKNPEMRSLMDRHAEMLLAQQVQGETEIEQEIREAIARQLADGVPPIEVVAAQLKVQPRTLQRRLSQAGSNYKDLVDDVRRRQALRYIEDPRLNLPEIAFLLGFSEQSSFQRAFKRWTGMPPGQYREGGT
ncbi:AraC family transcriptional regulator [Solimonas sp. K1W22B-7]|uniref:AraC family transcriptional regulator n=1 Tax=Solimonas sp. K1W22B-7 TaxID=2303331 RepID=UPI0013C4FE9B|nr:AraC family transcriptional regulator [Solimonas sp. K1W22B-7]